MTPYTMAATAPASCPASFSRAGMSQMSSTMPTSTTMVAPTATPLSWSEKVKLKRTVVAKAA
jgi:hypothetical protein